MPHVITQNCCNDATCVAVCPVDCIHPTPEERQYGSTEMLHIDPDVCIDCGACVDVCPVDAISPDSALSPEMEPYREVNAEYFRHHPSTPSPLPHMPPLPLSIATSGTGDRPPLRVAIVGSGPSGFYAAEELLARRDVSAEVTMFERLPVAGGLVRFGVAPDHWQTKTVARLFELTARRDGFAFRLGVDVGRDVTGGELLMHHHAVIHASGATGSRDLGIPGEHETGSHPAREFVAWYNGHPDEVGRRFDLDGKRAVVIGNGNVALDVARVLVSRVGDLARTDIADHALTALADSRIDEVVVLGRRGAEHAAFTTPELLGLGSVPGVDIVVEGQVEVNGDSPIKMRVLDELARREITPGNKRIVLRFGSTPREVIGDGGVSALRVADTDTGDELDIPCCLVLRAVGYRGQPVGDLPFDDVTGTVPNHLGRVTEVDSGEVSVGHYVTGWLKRGATGVIGTNRYCAAETVKTLVQDFVDRRLPDPVRSSDALDELVRERVPGVLDADDWRAIDRYEREQGRASGRPRVKIVNPDVAVGVAAGGKS